MKQLFTILAFFICLGYVESQSNQIIETYEIEFIPSFDDHLIVSWDLFNDSTSLLTLKQEYRVSVIDSLCRYDKCAYYFVDLEYYDDAKSLQKFNFIEESELTKKESKTYLSIFDSIMLSCKPGRIPSFDGIIENITHKNKGVIQTCGFESEATLDYHKMFVLLDLLENSPIYSIEKTIEIIKGYYVHRNFKIVSTVPLCVKIFSSSGATYSIVRSFVDKLPDSGSIFIDLTNYQGDDTPIFTEIFNEKYKDIRWIIDAKSSQEFKEEGRLQNLIKKR